MRHGLTTYARHEAVENGCVHIHRIPSHCLGYLTWTKRSRFSSGFRKRIRPWPSLNRKPYKDLTSPFTNSFNALRSHQIFHQVVVVRGGSKTSSSTITNKMHISLTEAKSTRGRCKSNPLPLSFRLVVLAHRHWVARHDLAHQMTREGNQPIQYHSFSSRSESHHHRTVSKSERRSQLHTSLALHIR